MPRFQAVDKETCYCEGPEHNDRACATQLPLTYDSPWSVQHPSLTALACCQRVTTGGSSTATPAPRRARRRSAPPSPATASGPSDTHPECVGGEGQRAAPAVRRHSNRSRPTLPPGVGCVFVGKSTSGPSGRRLTALAVATSPVRSWRRPGCRSAMAATRQDARPFGRRCSTEAPAASCIARHSGMPATWSMLSFPPVPLQHH